MPMSKEVYQNKYGGSHTDSELEGSHGVGWAQPQEGLKEEHLGEWEQQVLVACRSEQQVVLGVVCSSDLGVSGEDGSGCL